MAVPFGVGQVLAAFLLRWSDGGGDDEASAAKPAGRFAYEGLDRVIHEKARLSVLTSLAAHPNGLLFGDLKQLCGLTDGNLSRHLQVLQEAKLVTIVEALRAQPAADDAEDHRRGPAALPRLSRHPRTGRARRRERRESRRRPT